MAKFCSRCSAPVSGGILRDVPLEQPAPYAHQKRTARFCSRCGSATDPQTGFCPVCGATSRYTPQQQPGQQPLPQTPGQPLPPQKKKCGHAALWVVTTAAVLLAAAAIVGVLEHFRIVNIPAVRKLEERMGIHPYAAEAIYDDDGALLGYEVYKDNGDYFYYDAEGALEYCYIYKYNAARQPTKWSEYDGDGTLLSYSLYEYDSAGREIKYSYYDGDGTLTGYATFEYDSAGQVIKENYYDSDGTLDYYYTYEYNSAGQRIRIREYDGNFVLQATYDGDWNLIS